MKDTIYPCLFCYRSIYVPMALCLPEGLPSSKLDFAYGYYRGFYGVQPFSRSQGPSLASLYVVNPSLFNNNSLFSNLLFDHKVDHTLRGSIAASISEATTLRRHGNNESHSRFRNHFRRCATLLILLRFNNIYRALLSSHLTFCEKLLL